MKQGEVHQITFRNPYAIEPPGCNRQIVEHPNGSNDAIEVAVFSEHRYAFFYWWRWKQKRELPNPPCLVSLDWHQDLCHPSDLEREELDSLDVNSDAEVALFSWARLAGSNDGHILAGAYLNLIGNIYVLCRQGTFETDWEDEILEDTHGNAHTIKKFRSPESLLAALEAGDEQHAYFDIDLDYFVTAYETNGYTVEEYLSTQAINKLLQGNSPLMQWLFGRLEGFTIATEPEFCGGLLQSNQLLDVVNQALFTPSLFHQECTWKHLQ